MGSFSFPKVGKDHLWDYLLQIVSSVFGSLQDIIQCRLPQLSKHLFLKHPSLFPSVIQDKEILLSHFEEMLVFILENLWNGHELDLIAQSPLPLFLMQCVGILAEQSYPVHLCMFW